MRKRLFTLLSLLCPLLIAAGVSAEVYTVAGNNTTVFGTAWDPSNTDNEMTTTDDVNYTFKKEEVTLTAGTVEFKVVKGHAWGTEYPSSNYKLTIPEDAKYNVTITFNSSSSTVGATATKVEDVVLPDAVIDQVTISGDFGNWSNDLALEKTGDYTYQGVLDLTEKTTDILFKLTPTSSNSMIWIGSGQLTLEDENGWVSTASEGNFKLANSTSGYKTYTFTATWTPGSNAANGWTLKVEGKDLREEPIESIYTIAGTPVEVFGAEWQAHATYNEMEKGTDGIYTITKSNITLAAGTTIEFKVTLNQSWDTSYGLNGGEDNVTYTVDEAGIYDITFTFDPTATVPEPQISVVKVGDVEVDGQELVNGDHKVVIKGIHYTNLAENNYVLTITSEETMDGLGGSFWSINGVDGNDMRNVTVVEEKGKKLVLTVTSTSDPEMYTPLYVMMPGEVSFTGSGRGNAPIIEWEEQQAEVTYQVTFVNEAGWEGDIYAYAWSGDDKVLGDWPGTQMENEGNNTFSITLPSAAEYIIFTNNNGSKTADLAFENNKQYTNAEPTTVTYTVAGNNADIFGTAWDATNTDNDMTESDGIYTFTKTDIELAAGEEIKFKVVKNHSWDTSYGDAEGNDVAYTVKLTGSHDITITFDPSVGVPEITVTNDEEPVDGQELVNGDHKVVIKGVHYLNLTENNYVLTITSEEEMAGLSGSFWHVNGEGTEQLSTKSALREDNKQIVVTTTSTSDPQLYTPLYVMMPGEVNFGQPTIDWEEVGEVTPVEEYKVKFVNMAGWETVKAHAWNNDGAITEWPGIEGTAVDNTTAFGNSYPTFEFTFTSEPTNVQFNPGNNTKELNFTYVEGALYSYDGLADKPIFLFTDDANQFKPAQAYTVTEASASYARQFTPGNVCTVVLPFAIGADVAAAAGKFYRINSIADGYIRGTEETPAPYVPYIFVPATEYPFTNIGIGQLPAVQDNSITTAEGYTLQFVTETTELASDASYDYYGFQGGQFVKAAYATVNPFRSYIKVAKSANAPATLIWTDDEATGISSLKADIQNGKADVYDLQGRRVLNPVRGLYIVNGKKVIVK